MVVGLTKSLVIPFERLRVFDQKDTTEVLSDTHLFGRGGKRRKLPVYARAFVVAMAAAEAGE